MATHSSVLAWRIPGTGEPGGLPSMGSHRVGHDWSNLAAAAGPSFHYVSTSGINKSDSWPFQSPVSYSRDSVIWLKSWVNFQIHNRKYYDFSSCMSAQPLSSVWLFEIPWTVTLARLLCPRILQAKILEWGAISFSRILPVLKLADEQFLTWSHTCLWGSGILVP